MVLRSSDFLRLYGETLQGRSLAVFDSKLTPLAFFSADSDGASAFCEILIQGIDARMLLKREFQLFQNNIIPMRTADFYRLKARSREDFVLCAYHLCEREPRYREHFNLSLL